MFNYQDYDYDEAGNVKTIGDSLWSGGREFAYDDLNRLTQASGNFGPNLMEVTHNYTYDAIGNVLSKAGVLYYYCSHPLQPASPQYCTGPQHPSAVVNTSDGNVYTYDANGSTYTGAGRTYTWNVENRLAELSAPGGTVISTYDSTGTRIKKQASGAITYFPFAGYEVTGGVVTKYIRIGIEIIAANKGGEKRFYHNDHQGGVNIITDIFAGIVQLNEYDPWGKVTRSEGNVEPTKRFNGKEFDEESGLYYYGARYYDPNLMRFVSPDPFIQEPGNPQSFNRYSYTINNPQKYVDPSGHFFGLIFSLIFNQATASKLWAASDPIGFLLSKIPKKVNGGINIFGGIAMMLSGNPMGAFYVASGAMSFGKGNGFQIASQVLGFTGAAMSLLGGGGASAQAGVGGPGDDHVALAMPTGAAPGNDCPLCQTEDHYQGWEGLANMLMNEVRGLRGKREFLHKAQVAMGHVALNRAKLGGNWVTGTALPPEELNPAEAEAIANRYRPSVEAYTDAKAAAAEVVLNPNQDPTGGARFYILDYGQRLPSYYRGGPALEFGPFINAAGGGDVPKGATVYIRIFH